MSVKSNRQLLLQFHSEYTSITDELENVCHMITSPTLSMNRESSEKSCSNAEFAALLEKKHLQECEENDYLMLSKLFHNRDSINDDEDAFADVCHCSLLFFFSFYSVHNNNFGFRFAFSSVPNFDYLFSNFVAGQFIL